MNFETQLSKGMSHKIVKFYFIKKIFETKLRIYFIPNFNFNFKKISKDSLII